MAYGGELDLSQWRVRAGFSPDFPFHLKMFRVASRGTKAGSLWNAQPGDVNSTDGFSLVPAARFEMGGRWEAGWYLSFKILKIFRKEAFSSQAGEDEFPVGVGSLNLGHFCRGL